MYYTISWLQNYYSRSFLFIYGYILRGFGVSIIQKVGKKIRTCVEISRKIKINNLIQHCSARYCARKMGVELKKRGKTNKDRVQQNLT